jgi:protein-S-isoprenylcysteine O-methyltransferase Ste14
MVIMRNLWLALRSLFWTVAFPGFTAGYVPWRYFDVSEVDYRISNPLHLLGSVFIVLGAAILLTCIFEFARTGRGTLSPADPATVLVVRGLYRYVRNPMYVGVLTVIAGHLMLKPSVPLLIYWFFFFAVSSAFVIGFEEPYLRSRFGDSYDRYTQQVGRWIPGMPGKRVNG